DSGVEDYVRDCGTVNRLVGKKMASLVSQVPGIATTSPQGAFYLYLDFNEQAGQFRRFGLNTSVAIAEDLLHVEHTALLPGSALLLPEDHFSFRCSYVDYDGRAALDEYRSRPPATPEAEDAFVQRHCSLLVDGVRYMARYVKEVTAGRRPRHVVEPGN
ncbi:MAG: hypothetical protein V3R16_02955, partial [Nitrospirales bacterium]